MATSTGKKETLRSAISSLQCLGSSSGITQDPPKQKGGHPGRSSLTHLGHCLRALEKFIAKENPTSIALPRLATGVGGLDWDLVRPELQAHLGKLDIPVIVYTTYHADQAANEPL